MEENDRGAFSVICLLRGRVGALHTPQAVLLKLCGDFLGILSLFQNNVGVCGWQKLVFPGIYSGYTN